MKLGDIVDIAVSGLSAQRSRMAATASNLANAHTTRTESGGPYRRRDPVLASAPVGGPFAGALSRAIHKVDVRRMAIDPRTPITRFDPGHPDADADGNVALPRVNVVEELTNMMSASRSFEANLVVISKVRQMANAALQIGRS